MPSNQFFFFVFFLVFLSVISCRKSHSGDMTILWPSYIHNGIFILLRQRLHSEAEISTMEFPFLVREHPHVEKGPSIQWVLKNHSMTMTDTLHCIKRGSIMWHGPLTRFVKLRVAHAPGMLGTFSLPPQVIDPDMHHGICVTHVRDTRAVMHAGIDN